MSEKFLRYQQEHSPYVANYSWGVTHEAYAQLVSPELIDLDSDPTISDAWVRLKFRFNIDPTMFTTPHPTNGAHAHGSLEFQLRAKSYDFDTSNTNILPYVYIDFANGGPPVARYALSMGPSFVNANRTGELFFTGSYNTGSSDFTGASLPNFFNQINELIITKERLGPSSWQSRMYYGDAMGSGSVPLVTTINTTAGMTGTGSFAHSEWELHVMANTGPGSPASVNMQFFNALSFDIFEFEHGVGSLPAGIETLPVQLTGGGVGDSFSNYADIHEFIGIVGPTNEGDIVPSGSIYRDSWSQQNYPEFGINPFYSYIQNYSIPAGFSGQPAWGKFNGITYFDPDTYVAYDPGNIPTNGTWSTVANLIILPTSSYTYGTMMGPLSVGGSVSPPQSPVLSLNLSTVYLKYALNKAPSPRRGLLLQKTSGSPQLSLEPVWPTSSWHLAGDIWFSDTTGSARGLYYADYSSSITTVTPAASASIVPYKIFATTGSHDVIEGGTF